MLVNSRRTGERPVSSDLQGENDRQIHPSLTRHAPSESSPAGVIPSATDPFNRLEFAMKNTSTTDSGRIRLGGGFRLPASSKITLGGGFRLPASK